MVQEKLVKHQNVSKYYDQNCSCINYPRSTIHLFSKILLDKKTPKPTEVHECNFEIEISRQQHWYSVPCSSTWKSWNGLVSKNLCFSYGIATRRNCAHDERMSPFSLICCEPKYLLLYDILRAFFAQTTCIIWYKCSFLIY